MKQKLTSAALVCALVLLINILLYSFVYKRILPYHWGSNEVSYKREYLIRNKDMFNTIFIGSSKTHNQVMPLLFDQLSKNKKLDVRSYNFGVSGLTPLESLHIYENLLVHDSLHLTYAFIELDWIATIKIENLNVARSFYWLDHRNFFTSINSIANSSMPPGRRLWGFFHYSWDYTQNLMNTGKIQEYIKYKKNSNNQSFAISDSNIIYNGFVPMFQTLNKKEQMLFEEVVSSARSGVKNFGTLKNNNLSKPFLNKLEEIVFLSKSKGITPFFIVPLQWKYYQYKELIPVIQAIKGARVFCMFDIEKYSEVYKTENFADPNHLNAFGAKLYTEKLFELFNAQVIHQ